MSGRGDSRLGPWLVWIGFVILFILHQDTWYWSDRTLVFGFMPVGLLYHAVYSIGAGLLWSTACRQAWPHRIEQWAEGPEQDAGS